MESSTPAWDKIIEPKRSLLDLRLREVWHYRDLLLLFVKRDITATYKQTALGPAWFFIQPIFTTIVYTFVFGNLAGISADGLPRILFYLAGITCWNYFSESLTKTSTVFKDNAHIFGKVYFPRLVMPASIVLSGLLRFAIQLLLFLLVLVFYMVKGETAGPAPAILLFPLIVLLMAMLGLGLGLIITAMTTRYRDLSFLLVFGIQLFMYATPVVYPLSYAPEKYRWLIELNPMTGIVESFRYAFLGKGILTPATLGYSAVFSVVVLFLGILIFNRTERNFVDTI